MSAKKMCLSFMLAIVFIGFVMLGTSHSLTFNSWTDSWFTVKSSEKGKIGPAYPLVGDLDTNNEKTTTTYLVLESFEISSPIYISTLDITVPAFVAGYCVFEGSTWVKHPVTLPILGGEPEKFLTLFTFQNEESGNISQSSWIPLEVKGQESKNTPGEITSASFKNLGGIFHEEVDNPSEGGVGSVKFTGSFIKTDQVTDKVPPACQVIQ